MAAAGVDKNFLANQLDCHPETVRLWETGSTLPSATYLEKIPLLLKCSLGWLFGAQEASPPPPVADPPTADPSLRELMDTLLTRLTEDRDKDRALLNKMVDHAAAERIRLVGIVEKDQALMEQILARTKRDEGLEKKVDDLSRVVQRLERKLGSTGGPGPSVEETA